MRACLWSRHEMEATSWLAEQHLLVASYLFAENFDNVVLVDKGRSYKFN